MTDWVCAKCYTRQAIGDVCTKCGFTFNESLGYMYEEPPEMTPQDQKEKQID